MIFYESYTGLLDLFAWQYLIHIKVLCLYYVREKKSAKKLATNGLYKDSVTFASPFFQQCL